MFVCIEICAYVCLPLTPYHTHQRNHSVSFYRTWTTIAITGKKAAQWERHKEKERENTDNTNKAPTYAHTITHKHTHSHPLSKLWRNLGLALVFTTKVQWSIAKPKNKVHACVCVREWEHVKRAYCVCCSAGGALLRRAELTRLM